MLMKNFIVVANRTGGQGKTLLAHLLALSSSPDRVVMCADTVDDSAGGVSKLGRMLRGVIEIGAGPTAAEVSKDAQSAYGYWDVIGEHLFGDEGNPVILDVGANVVDRIFEWGVVTGFEDALGDVVQSSLVVPVVARPKSLSDAADVVREAVRYGKEGGIVFSHIILVRNHWQGGFDQVEGGEEYKALKEAIDAVPEDISCVVLDLPRCDSDLLRILEERHLSLKDVSGLDFSEIAELFSWKRMKASREQKLFNAWLNACCGLIQDALPVVENSGVGAKGADLDAVLPQ